MLDYVLEAFRQCLAMWMCIDMHTLVCASRSVVCRLQFVPWEINTISTIFDAGISKLTKNHSSHVTPLSESSAAL